MPVIELFINVPHTANMEYVVRHVREDINNGLKEGRGDVPGMGSYHFKVTPNQIPSERHTWRKG